MRITNTTVFRMAMLFALVFATITIVALLSVYFVTLIELRDQIDIELQHELEDLQAAYHAGGDKKLVELIENREHLGRHLLHFYAVTNQDNERIAGNKILSEGVSSYATSNNRGINYLDISSQALDDEDDGLLRAAEMVFPDGMKVIVAQSQNSIVELQEHTFVSLLITVAVTLILALLCGIYMGRIVLSGIAKIDNGLDKAISSDFTEKLLLPENNNEFKSLTVKLNITLERIEKLLIGMRQVTDNIAHDLLSPLTRLRNRLEVTLLNPRNELEYRETMVHVLEDTDELINTFNALLSIAQAEAKVHRENFELVNLSTLLEEIAELYSIVAEERQQSFECIINTKISIQANRQLLAQAISNLLENAIKYCGEFAHIKLELTSQDGHPVISVSDNGPGIPIADRERVLERFQRLDTARNSSGSGLGLSLANAIAKLHNATLLLEDNNPGLNISIIFSR